MRAHAAGARERGGAARAAAEESGRAVDGALDGWGAGAAGLAAACRERVGRLGRRAEDRAAEEAGEAARGAAEAERHAGELVRARAR